MYNSNPPSKADLPSSGKLIKSTILAAVAAGVLLVTVVMPAEYGIDPTGIGKLTGLQKMGAIKASLAKDAALEEANKEEANKQTASTAPPAAPPVPVLLPLTSPVSTTPPTSEPIIQTHEKIFTLAPDAWTEIKLEMTKGAKADFVWFTDGGKANFDTHADSKPLNIDYHSYAKGSKVRSEGVLEAAFAGNHGWFWRNRTDKPMTITLQTKGPYTKIVVMD